jgi:hypothetical protein
LVHRIPLQRGRGIEIEGICFLEEKETGGLQMARAQLNRDQRLHRDRMLHTSEENEVLFVLQT